MALHQKDERKTSCTQVLAYMSSRENAFLCDAVVTPMELEMCCFTNSIQSH